MISLVPIFFPSMSGFFPAHGRSLRKTGFPCIESRLCIKSSGKGLKYNILIFFGGLNTSLAAVFSQNVRTSSYPYRMRVPKNVGNGSLQVSWKD